MKNKIVISLGIIFACLNGKAQEIKDITPLSPNAASVAKYGEIPVGYFTGVPNISVPIYTIESKELSLPLSLSYHAGGNKVEAIASWVGLGWSLNTIPSISRSIRSLPDEIGGYFSKFRDKTIEELWAEMELNPTSTLSNEFESAVFNGEVDCEPDIYFYSILGESGKFYYNQEREEFVTFPKTNIKIKKVGSAFQITNSDGSEYFFGNREFSDPTEGIISSWYASTIVSASKSDTIKFKYEREIQNYRTMSTSIKYVLLSGSSGLSDIPPTLVFNRIDVPRLDTIIFNNGYVKFHCLGVREDLQGGYSLDSISIYDKSNNLINRYRFQYKYLVGGSPLDIDNSVDKWMLLEKFSKVSNDLKKELSHNFYYNESVKPKNRLSAAQDYWGYYNGKETNENLIPETSTYTYQGSPIHIQGADRNVVSSKANFGIIKKIVYPTGGYTEFEFESHKVSSSDIAVNYINQLAYLAGDDYFDEGDIIPITSSFISDTFEIENPPEQLLNSNNPDGGAFVDFSISNYGCELNGDVDPCATFAIKCVTPGCSVSTYYIPENRTFYLPNGRYVLTASFDQTDPKYEGFYFSANWQKVDTSTVDDKTVGGLRIKEIRSYTTPSSNPLIKKYKYTEGYDLTKSSGEILGLNTYNYSTIIHYEKFEYALNEVFSSIVTCLELKSYSNAIQVTHSSSHVGYKNVIEETRDSEKTGYTEYEFSNMRDEQSASIPYSPGQNMEVYRGQLIKETSYIKQDHTFKPLREKRLFYNNESVGLNGSSYPLITSGIKWISDKKTNFWEAIPISEQQNYTPYIISTYHRLHRKDLYSINQNYSRKLKEIIKDYYMEDTLTTYINYYYNDTAHLYVNRQENISSDGKVYDTEFYYPQDYNTLTGNFDVLVNKNIVNRYVDKRESVNNKLIFGNQVTYNDNGLPTDIYNYESFNEIPFDTLNPYTFTHKKEVSYTNSGRIKKLTNTNGIITYFIWAHNDQYPVVKIDSKNADIQIDQIQADVDLISLSNSPEINIINSDITNLKSKVEPYINPDDHVSYYTYNALIGITSITDSNGRSEYYIYDGFGRLQYILDDNENVLKKHEYNYINK